MENHLVAEAYLMRSETLVIVIKAPHATRGTLLVYHWIKEENDKIT